MSLDAVLALSLTSQFQKVLDVSTPTDSVQIGASSFPAVGYTLADGNGNLQAQAHWTDARTLAAGANDDLDLSGGLTGPLGDPFTLLTVRLVIVQINSPDGTKKLRVGPQGATGAAQLGFGGVAATNYVETDTFLVLSRPYGGWAVTATTADILRINNPSAVSVTYTIYVAGTTS